mmetsp:Transcript_11335/g.31603  ORF Transcript_11335/g.31603 Transcript_11335/m.31603 type:complete len:275 (+) Transcript_11335:942-1766(+)
MKDMRPPMLLVMAVRFRITTCRKRSMVSFLAWMRVPEGGGGSVRISLSMPRSASFLAVSSGSFFIIVLFTCFWKVALAASYFSGTKRTVIILSRCATESANSRPTVLMMASARSYSSTFAAKRTVRPLRDFLCTASLMPLALILFGNTRTNSLATLRMKVRSCTSKLTIQLAGSPQYCPKALLLFLIVTMMSKSAPTKGSTKVSFGSLFTIMNVMPKIATTRTNRIVNTPHPRMVSLRNFSLLAIFMRRSPTPENESEWVLNLAMVSVSAVSDD